MDYETTVRTLFAMLTQANAADTAERKGWQVAPDASSFGYFGHLRDALKEIAGEAIFDHWCDTNEIDMALASRAICRK
jgi:hypothetical protein